MAFDHNSVSYKEQYRAYTLKKGAHKLKNRSSKHLRFIGGMRDIYRCMSNAMLNKLSDNGCFTAEVELTRRSKKRMKRESKTA